MSEEIPREVLVEYQETASDICDKLIGMMMALGLEGKDPGAMITGAAIFLGRALIMFPDVNLTQIDSVEGWMLRTIRQNFEAMKKEAADHVVGLTESGAAEMQRIEREVYQPLLIRERDLRVRFRNSVGGIPEGSLPVVTLTDTFKKMVDMGAIVEVVPVPPASGYDEPTFH